MIEAAFGDWLAPACIATRGVDSIAARHAIWKSQRIEACFRAKRGRRVGATPLARLPRRAGRGQGEAHAPNARTWMCGLSQRSRRV